MRGREWDVGVVPDSRGRVDGAKCCGESWLPRVEASFPYWCTRDRGHDGPHRAGTGEWTVAEWDDQ